MWTPHNKDPSGKRVKQAGAELGPAQRKLGLGFTSVYLC